VPTDQDAPLSSRRDAPSWRGRTGAWLSVIALASACGGSDRPKSEPLGRLPTAVTTAEPEWLPFAIRAGSRCEEDPRERHLGELRTFDVGGDVARAAFSPDGHAIALEARLSGDERSQVYVMNLGTGALHRASVSTVDATSPHFTPSGDRLLFAEASPAGRRVVEVPVGGGPAREIVSADATDPAPLGDGSGVVFVRAEAGKADLFVQPLGGLGPLHALLREPRFDESSPALSPDRTRIAWIARTARASVLWTAHLPGAGGEARAVEALSTDLESVRTPSFLPDARRLAFASDRDDPASQIYVVDLDERFGPGAPPRSTRITFAEGGSEAPTFSSDGRHVAFVSRRNVHRAPAERRLFVARWVEDP
jgi:Tol biopolymer transport system component